MKRSTEPRAHALEPSEEEVQKCAYFLWLEEGRPAGRDLDLWLTAKELVRHQIKDHPPRPGPKRPLAH